MDVQYIEHKLTIFQSILSVNNLAVLYKLESVISNILNDYAQIHKLKEAEDAPDLAHWETQFADTRNPNEYIPEYQMTLREFRHQIYEAELGKQMSMSEFENKISQWKTTNQSTV